ncbi:MAG: hypothetical protein HY922_09770 [Elusimicrobia bacterium]|nr:hypothetical protein [Elusimicrobiota bacterium]
MKLPPWAEKLLDLFSDEDDPSEPFYDPVHLGAAVMITLVAIGCLYWLLWTLLVYEGGLFGKIVPALRVIFTSKTLQDYGYRGEFDRGVFEGWFGNLAALALCIAVVIALRRLYMDGRRKHETSR